MMFDRAAPLFSRDFMALKILATLYVLALILLHAASPIGWTWGVAAVLSIAMNFTYIWAARQTGKWVRVETVISLALIGMAAIGFFVSTVLIILSIFLHGVWDLFKHNGRGVPFFKWYTLGCVTVDWTYSAALFVFWMIQ